MTFLELVEAVDEAVTDGRYVSVSATWSKSSYSGNSFRMSIYDHTLAPSPTANPTAQGVFDAWQAKWDRFDVDEAVHEMELPKEATQ